jgi:hypothetical protein
MDYEAFKAVYGGVLGCASVGCLAAITAFNPWVTLWLFAAFLVIGGAYITRREGWL